MVELLKTKLFIPRSRPRLIARARLTERLNSGLDKKLTLISAPAGFGKSTLLSEWIPLSSRCVTWFSLDDGDNDPIHFWTYFIASLQQLNSQLGADASALLQSPQAPSINSILTSLINDITAFPDTFAIVLDDYHVIGSQPIHDALTFLIDHLPANMHLIITTRVDPLLPIARLRARDKLTELRANDLRFTTDEVAAFLIQAMGLNLSTEEIAALETRTDGWIAGLQIAALSMQGRDDISGFIETFSGSHRHILGYLAEEVINQQPEAALNFLLQTSILDRLCGPLCDAVTGGTNGQTILESLERANLFIIPLDDEGKWYRYHHLFAEVLQARLRQSQPELPAKLQLRASEWFEMQNLMGESIQYAFSCGAESRAANLIERQRWILLGRGDGNTLHRLLDELKVETVRSRPGLSLAYAWIFSLLEQPDAMERHLLDAEKALAEITSQTAYETDEYYKAIQGEIATLRAEATLGKSDIPGGLALSRHALTLLSDDNKLMRGVATYFLGHGERRSGHMVEAELAYQEAITLGLQADYFLLALYALSNLSNVQIIMGHLSAAEKTSRRILQITSEYQRQTWPVAGLAYEGLGKLHYEWNDLNAATHHLRQGIEFGHRGGLINLELHSRNILARTLQAQGDMGGVDQMLREISVINDQNRHPAYTPQSAAWEARLRLQQGKIDQAILWADSCGLSVNDSDLSYSRQIEYLTIARVLIAQRSFDGVENMLNRMMQSAETGQRTGELIEILIQQAIFFCVSNNPSRASQTIERALLLAEPEGFIRTFVDEGEPMRLLLIDFQSTIKERINKNVDDDSLRIMVYIDKLLTAFSHTARIDESNHAVMLESLSERELGILRLIATGRSNQEIAELLVISVSTVKTHINRLYSKLGVQRRTEAIVVAREIGLID